MRHRYLLTLTQPKATEDLEDAVATGLTWDAAPMIAVEAVESPGPVTVHFTEAEARAILHAAEGHGVGLTPPPDSGTPTLAAAIRKLTQLTPKPWTGTLREG